MFFYKNYGHLQRREDAVLIIQGNKEIKIKSYNLLYGKSLNYFLLKKTIFLGNHTKIVLIYHHAV